MKNSEVFLWFVIKMLDSTPTTVPSYWEKSPTGKGSLDCHKLFIASIMSLYGEQQTGLVLVVGQDLQVKHTVPSTLVLFSLRAV